MRKPLIAGNWKMYKTVAQAIELVEKLIPRVRQVYHCDIMVAPPFTALQAVSRVLEGTNLSLGAQNMHWENEGAYTGEISPRMLVDLGCEYVIIGHSERREHFFESDAMINRKLIAALGAGLRPILCIGEKLSEREAGGWQTIVEAQLSQDLASLTAPDISRIIIAYEPIWAIGTGKTATPEIAQQVHAFIRSYLEARYGGECAAEVRVLYGGSVKPENISGLMSQPDIDGALVGGASLDAEGFARIVNYQR